MPTTPRQLTDSTSSSEEISQDRRTEESRLREAVCGLIRKVLNLEDLTTVIESYEYNDGAMILRTPPRLVIITATIKLDMLHITVVDSMGDSHDLASTKSWSTIIELADTKSLHQLENSLLTSFGQ